MSRVEPNVFTKVSGLGVEEQRVNVIGLIDAVFAVANNRATKRSIIVGHRNDSMVEVLSGLQAGDQVILFPSDQIADRVRVRGRS